MNTYAGYGLLLATLALLWPAPGGIQADEVPGGPILIVASSANPYGRYIAEVLRTEGLNAFGVADVSELDANVLAPHHVVILGETDLASTEVAFLTDWVEAGGQLVALRPDPQLAGLLGLGTTTGTLSDAYLRIDTGQAPGTGLVSETLQFHGAADLWTLAGATALATLYSDAATPTPYPAVTLRLVGSNGGSAAAFTYDLARSIVYTRQGNPAWAGQERDGTPPRRSDDLFYGAAAGDPQPDWIDLGKVAVPQADEQQRLFAGLVRERIGFPLPRFWYFPDGKRAVVILTGDQHGCCGGTRDRFNANLAADPPGCSVDDWECVRSSSYIYPDPGMSNTEAASFSASGFELGVHVNTNCADWTPAQLEGFFGNQLGTFAALFPGLPVQDSHRTHCIAWSDWSSAASVELAHGIRLDTNYYYWPPAWVADRPGFFTGSGMPMRFAGQDGSLIDVYQAATQMTDESGQSYPFTIDTLLDRALGAQGYFGAFTATMHTDGGGASVSGAASIVASAQARGVPVVSGRQMLEWLDARNASSFGNIQWSGSSLQFNVTRQPAARNLRALLPRIAGANTLAALTRDGSAAPYSVETIRGIEYAVFSADTGLYVATYAPAPVVCADDDTVADFAAGSAGSGVEVFDVVDGELGLAAAVSTSLDGAALPPGWSAVPWQSGGGADVSGGALHIDGARVGTDTYFAPGRSLEFSASFAAAPFQHAGFGDTFEGQPWAIFSTGSDGTSLLARTAGGSSIDTALGAGLLGAPHRFRIAWGGSSVAFFVDGNLVATHAVSIAASMRPLASDLNAGGPELTLDWLRMSPYAASGSFDSRIFDAGATSSWDAVTWTSTEPAGTAVSLALRAGDTPVPDASWSAFSPIAAPGSEAGVVGRYAQYRADLETSDATATPLLEDVTLACRPNDGDSDQDGILDVYETGTGVFVSPTDTGTDPLDPDSDDDGFSDGAEVAAGTNPNDPQSPGEAVPAIGRWSAGALALILLIAGSALGRARRGFSGSPADAGG